MFCKNCGAQLSDNAKFCTSCGSKVEVEAPKQQQDYYQEQPQQDHYSDDYYDEEPKQESNFNYNQGLQEGTTYTDRPSNVYGKKFSAGASGNIKFGDPNKRPSFLRRLIVGGITIAIIIIAYTALFGDSGPIYDVQLGTEINSSTYYPDESFTEFIAGEGILYVSYSTRDMEIGEYFHVEIYDTTFGDTFIDSEYVSVDYDEQYGYVWFDYNWTPGNYEVRFEYFGEVVSTTAFTVDYE